MRCKSVDWDRRCGVQYVVTVVQTWHLYRPRILVAWSTNGASLSSTKQSYKDGGPTRPANASAKDTIPFTSNITPHLPPRQSRIPVPQYAMHWEKAIKRLKGFLLLTAPAAGQAEEGSKNGNAFSSMRLGLDKGRLPCRRRNRMLAVEGRSQEAPHGAPHTRHRTAHSSWHPDHCTTMIWMQLVTSQGLGKAD
uniref:Uncharacterized protein n=1 Tax=Eutreptiella gymnastica TaxID=73025 RepID=A0A7S4FE40_9EUGL